MPKQSVKDISHKDRTVLMRVDFNVPLDADGRIIDDRRIRMAIPTIEHVLKEGGRLVLMSHLGRPAGDGPEAAFSLKPVAERLDDLLGKHHGVRFATDCVGALARDGVNSIEPGDALVLENLRFHAGEKKNDPEFAASLAELADVYVNDAFGTAHRDHASMVGVPEHMSGKPHVAGLLLIKELAYLSSAITEAKAPFYAVLGGAKVSDKLGAIRYLLDKVDVILVGGAMAYTFLSSQGHVIGKSLVEEDMIEIAGQLLQAAQDKGKKILLPEDHQCSTSLDDLEGVRNCELGIPPDCMGLDIGPETARAWKEEISKAKTVVWNGPLGVFEKPPFDRGSRAVAEGIADATKHHAVSIVGGGETAAAIESFDMAKRFSHISTGGGASLKMLEGVSFRSVELLDEA